MPNYDGTGPLGMGPRTGRGFGGCGNGMGRFWNSGDFCPRRGFGFRRFFSPKNELAELEDEEKMLEEELSAVREAKTNLKSQKK